MNKFKLEELRFLRQELDMNRRFVFERPLVIVGATLAAALALSEKGLLGALPVPFLLVLAFNLWFTFNRLQSSARIVAYLQLVHEREELPWCGWETALRAYRVWIFRVANHEETRPTVPDPIPQFDSMAYYPQIFRFHLYLGIVVTVVLVGESTALSRVLWQNAHVGDWLSLLTSSAALLVFLLSSVRYRPRRVRHDIEVKRLNWQAVYQRIMKYAAPAGSAQV